MKHRKVPVSIIKRHGRSVSVSTSTPPPPVTNTFHILDGNGNRILDGNGNPLVWRIA